jgi:hypothetical protein
VLLDVLAGLMVELNQTVHGNSDGDRLDDDDLSMGLVNRCKIQPFHRVGDDPKHTQICENAGLSDASQYTPKLCVTTATMVIRTRITQY